jgi:Peptidase family M28/PDZ domain/PA domain
VQLSRFCLPVAALAFLLVLPSFLRAGSAGDISPDAYLRHIKYLSSPELKGRLTGTPELNRAADYIASQFGHVGLQPVGGSYFQPFEVTARTGLSDGDILALNTAKGISQQLKQGTDFIPLNLSANGRATGGLVFAGYGITAPEYHYDDYAGVDVRDKIVLILRHEPQENDPNSVFNGKNLTDHALFSSKAVNAKLHGAKALLIVNDAPNHSGRDELSKFEPLMATEDYGILIDQISVRVADELLAQSHKDLAQEISAIDRQLRPDSFLVAPAERATIAVDLKQERRTTRNVVGYWPGQTDEYVILGAHYDHLGTGQQDSLAPSQIGTIHPGADDNASGTAGIIELARSTAARGQRHRGLLFLCFAGEEEGLLGSAYYVAHPLKPLSGAVAMINLDMIGRLRDNKLYVGGVGTGSGFKTLIEQASQRAALQADESEAGGYGASDHTSFTAKQIPTLFFFSGLHGDYHKPSDTWDKINSSGAVRVLREVSEISCDLADAPGRPQFIRLAANPHAGGTGVSGGGGYGPYFGSVPDFGGPPHGVRFSDVRDGSPAAKAGFRAGDVLVDFGGKPIDNLYDFTYALRQHKPGDRVQVKVLRNGAAVTAEVVLTKRD